MSRIKKRQEHFQSIKESRWQSSQLLSHRLLRKFMSGVADRNFLKSYISKRRSAGIVDNADLIKKYLNFLSVRDLNNYSEVLFILQAGLLYDSIAYKLSYTNRKLIPSIYRTEPLPMMVALDNAIITIR